MTVEVSPQEVPLWHVTLSALEAVTLSGNEHGQASASASKTAEASSGNASAAPVSVQLVEKLRKEGASVMEGEVAKHKREQKLSKIDAEWYKTVLKKGTISDRISAYTLAFQASPLHGLEHLKSLLEMAKSKSRHEALLALDALKDLFCQNECPLIPPGRKLRYMHQQPVNALGTCTPELRRQAALLWYFEESLKAAYLEIIKTAEILTQDPILHARERGCRLIYEMLRANPFEQESNIMALLANKLGDSERRLASRIPYYFSELVNAHPRQLTLSAVEHVRQVMDRPGVSDRCKYYALTFLVQIRLSRSAPAITAALLQIYLGLFKTYIINSIAQESSKDNKKNKFNSKRQKRLRHRQKQRGIVVEAPSVPEEHARMAKMLLTGINRAFPFASNAGDELKQLLLSFSVPLLQLCQPGVAFPTTIQALNLLLTLAPHDQSLRQSVLRAIQSLLDNQDRLRTASASYPLVIRVIGRSLTLMIDSNDRAGVEIMLKSLLRFCLSIISPSFVVASLVLFEATLARLPVLKAMVHVAPDSIDSARKGSAFELVALTRHYHPRVRRYALALLRTCRASTAADAEINAAPFEKISFSLFLDVWSRMRRTEKKEAADKKKSAAASAALVDGLDSDGENELANRVFQQDESRKRAPKLTDNAEIAAALYTQDEFSFVADFAAEKDRRTAAEVERAEKARKKRRAGSEADEDDIEAEADAFMEEAIRGMIPGEGDSDDDFDYGSIGGDSDDEEADEDDDFVDDSDNSDDYNDKEFASESENDSQVADTNDIEDMDEDQFSDASHESDDINLFLKDSDDEVELVDNDLEDEIIADSAIEAVEEADEEEEVKETKKAKKSKNSRKKIDKSKLYKGVFASASDYEDALQD